MKYFFTEVRSTTVCLICQDTVAVFKEYNISSYFAIKHANYASKQSLKNGQVLLRGWQPTCRLSKISFTDKLNSRVKYQGKFYAGIQISKGSASLSPKVNFFKECMVDTAGLLCPESKAKFEKNSLSRRTMTCRVEPIDEDIASESNKKAEFFKLYLLALDEVTT